MIENQGKNTEMDEVISFGYTDEDFNFADPAEYLYEAGEEEHTTTTPDGKKVTVKTPRYAVSLRDLAECACLRYMPATYAGKLYLYNNNTQLYNMDTGEISHWVQSQIFRLIDTGKLPKSTRPHTIVDSVSKLVANGRPLSIDRYPFNAIRGYPVNNGVIMFGANGETTLKPHEVDDFITRKSPIDYNPDADTSLAERVLKSWLPEVDEDGNELWQYLLQIPAQAIVQSLPEMTPFKKAYMLLGDRDSGKSTYNNVCKRLFGSDNITTKTLQSFSERFAAGDLVGKYLNFGDDICSLRVDEGNEFKTLVGLSQMSVEQKYRDTYTAPVTAVHAYSANRLPSLDRAIYSDDAWWSRWIIINFSQHFPRDPTWEYTNLTKEFYEGFLVLVVRYASKLISCRKLPLDQDWRSVQSAWIGGESKLHDWFVATFERDETNYFSVDKNMALESLHTWATDYLPVPSYISKQGDNAIRDWRRTELNILPRTLKSLTISLANTEGVTQAYTNTGGTNADGTPERVWKYAGLAWKPVPWKPSNPNDGGGNK